MCPLDECPLCGGDLERRKIVDTFRAGTRSIQVASTPLVCDVCGEGFYGPGEIGDRHIRAITDVRSAAGRLLPWEVRTIRKGLGMSRLEFGTLLGVAPQTVRRWEGVNFCHGKAVDLLLRVVASSGEAVTILRERA